MEAYKIYLFGHPRLEHADGPVTINRRKMLALLSYLLVSRQPHSREALATLLWPDFDASSALANLRRDLSRLKEVLGDDLLQIEREKVQVNPASHTWVDLWQFEECVRQAEQHNHSPWDELTCRHCQALREEAANHYSGDFLAGFNLPDSPAFDEWQFFHGERLRGLLADVLVKLANGWTAQGNYEKAIEPARRRAALDPLHEPAQRMLIELYARAGQPSAALRQYQVLADLLQQELGARPEDETTALYEAVRSRRLGLPVSPAEPSLPKENTPAPPAQRFRVDTLLSKGGFGEIYRGYDHQTGKAVAIKRLLPDLVASHPEIVERFVREGQALGQLSHPNIIPLLGFFEQSGAYNLVMEYLPGGTLRDLLIREHSLGIDQACGIALELADALSRAHHLHILHRDLKPENILLDEQGHPRLIDFGLALLQGKDSRLTQAGMLLGSPVYMSPEAIRGEELDQRSDIWSFGVLLYEMLAGRPPFESEQIHVLLNQILNQDPPPLHHCCEEIPAALAQLVRKMLEKDREQRLPSMRQAAAGLEAIRAGKELSAGSTETQPTGAQPAGTPQLPTCLIELPPQTAPLIGRDRELEELNDLLRNPAVRLVTLAGPGGIGKTRLAVEAARQMLKDFPNGAVFVPLAPVNDPDFILPAIANALHFRFTPGSDLKTQLVHRINGLKLLLVLDNFEHLANAAELAAELLAAAGQVKILVTSRERLNLMEEWVYEVGGLPYPQPEMEEMPGPPAEAFGAVQLFIERARRADPKFQVNEPNLEAPNKAESTLDAIVRICQLVEGMPLAIELAAPWVRAMSCAEIAQELEHNLDILTSNMRNLPDRHRSLRVVFDQSWQSLSETEQEVLARLSVFHNGCTREAGEKVAGAKPAVLMALVDKALLRHRANRFEMHELVRQYAAERLGLDPGLQEETLERHHHFYLDLLQVSNAGYKGGRQLETALMINTDIDNIRAAWNHAVQRRDRQALCGAAESYWLYNEFRGTLAQGVTAFRQAAEIVQPPEEDRVLAGFLLAAQGSLLARQWYFDQGYELMARGLSLLRQAERYDHEKVGFALAWLAFLLVLRGQYPQATLAAQESLEHFPQSGDRWTQAGALRLLGASALYQGQLQRAEAYLNQCVVVCKSIGELRIRTYATANLGVIHLWYGQMEEARRYFDESLRISKTCNDRLSRADAFCERVRFFMATGEYDQAIETAQKSIQVYHELGRTRVSLANIMLGKALRLKGEDGAQEALQAGLEAARQVNHRPDIASGLEGLGSLLLDCKQYDEAQAYFHESLQIWEEIGNEPEIGTLLCRISYGMLAAGSEDFAAIREKLVRALHLGRKHQAGTVAISAMVGLAALQIQSGDAGQAAQALLHAKNDPATPHEVRGWVELLSRRLPSGLPEVSLTSPPAHWNQVVDRLVQQNYAYE